MARYILALSVESNFYREYHEEPHTDEELLEQLKGDIEDQVAEYDLSQLVKRMLSFEGTIEIPIIVDRVEQPVMNV
jgi:hypothetical protein